MTGNEPMLERVRKLLAKAEANGTTEAEQAALIDKAAEIIAKYGLSAALAQSTGSSDDKVQHRTLVLPAPYSKAKAELLDAIAKPLRVELVYNIRATKERNDGGYQVTLFGWGADLERLEALFTSLLLQSAAQVANVKAETRWAVRRGEWVQVPAPGRSTASARRDWYEGYGNRIAARLREAERQAQQEETSTGTDLVLADRGNAVELFLKNMYPKLKAMRSREVRDGAAYDRGYIAGGMADLGGTRVTRGKTRELTK